MATDAQAVTIQRRRPKPAWLKVRAPGSPKYQHLKELMRGQALHTVCEEAHCPNIGECWHHGTATFMILGDICTRACGYCAVAHGRPAGLDTAEPERVAAAADTMNLRYVVITSVDRDDLPTAAPRSSQRPSGRSGAVGPSAVSRFSSPTSRGRRRRLLRCSMPVPTS